MKIILLIYLIFWVKLAARGEQQLIWAIPHYSTSGGTSGFDCLFHNAHHCTWMNNNASFDPIQYGYRYEFKNNNCSIRIGYLSNLRGISCVGYINYNTIIIDAIFSQTIRLNCEFPAQYSECLWKLNGVIVPITEKYSYATYPGETHNCSLRISNVEDIDAGNWTCCANYNENDGEIFAAYSIALINKSVNEDNSHILRKNTEGCECTSASSNSSTSIIALCVCISVLILIIIGLTWKSMFERKFPPRTRQPEVDTYDDVIHETPINNEIKDSSEYLTPRPTEVNECGERTSTCSGDENSHIYEQILYDVS